MADFETALADLATAVKDVGTRVSADITALKDELASMGVTVTARFQAAADSIEAQAKALADIDPAAPVVPVVSNTPGTPPAAAGTTVAADLPADVAPGAGPAAEQSPTATPTDVPPTP